MTTDSEFDRRAREWMEDGPVQAADPVLHATLAAVHTTPQQHRQALGRFNVSITTSRLIAAAAVILLVVGGAFGISALRTPNGVVAQPSPDASSVPSARPSSAAASTRPAPAVFVDPNTYLFAMDPGYASPGTDAPPSWLQLVSPSDPHGHELSIGVDGGLRDPSWSPDGTKIAFTAATKDTASAWTAAADGSDPVQVATCASPCTYLDWPSFSPDGTQLVVTETDLPEGKAQPTEARVVVLTLDGGVRSVVATGGPDALPGRAGWSPDGKHLVYERVTLDVTGRPTASSLSTIGADGTGDEALTGLPAFAAEPDWSADGVIAFEDALNILTVPAAGGTPTKITSLSATSQQRNRSPRWTPDGRVSFVHEPTNGTNVLMSVAADGSDPAVIFAGGGRVYPDTPVARP